MESTILQSIGLTYILWAFGHEYLQLFTLDKCVEGGFKLLLLKGILLSRLLHWEGGRFYWRINLLPLRTFMESFL